MELFFCVYFGVEWFIRLMAFENKWNCVQDAWFVFDSMLCFIMFVETVFLQLVLFPLLLMDDSTGIISSLGNTVVLKMFRMVRLTRVCRVARLFKALEELMILIKGIWVAARSVMFTLL